MTVPVKILSVLTGLSLAGSVQARIWTNDRGATVVAVLVAVRDAEVDLKLQDGRIVAVPKNVFSGADQAYILEWVKSGGTLPDTDVGAENPPAQGASGGRYVPLEPNWDAPWPERAAAPGYLLVKAVQETDELSVYETDHFVIESPGKLPETERMALARRFETILSALAAVPMNLAVARRPSRKYLVRVCFQEEDFNKAPGLRNGRLKFSPTSFTALLLRDKKGKPLKLDAVDPRFAVTHWVAQSMDLEHWLVDGFSAYMAFLPMEKEAMVFRKLPGRLAAMLPRAVRTAGSRCLPWRTCWRGIPFIPPQAMASLQRGTRPGTGPICYGRCTGAIWKGTARRNASGVTWKPGMRRTSTGRTPFCWTGRLRKRWSGKWPQPGKNWA